MSYCTIEEAWGHLGITPSNEPSFTHKSQKKTKHRKLKKRSTRTNTKTKCTDDIQTDSNSSDTSYEPFTNPDDTNEHPLRPTTCQPVGAQPDVRYESDFTRSAHTTYHHLPEALDISLEGGGAPFEIPEDTDDENNSPTLQTVYDEDTYNVQDASQSNSSALQKNHTFSSQLSTKSQDRLNDVAVHEELEWMRNNMSHLSNKIEKLTNVIDTSQKKVSTEHTHTQAYDTFIFLLVGVFVLVALDIFFRAGKRVSV